MRYIVIASSISYYRLEINAASEDDAWKIAKDADGGDFVPDGEGDWEIVDVREDK